MNKKEESHFTRNGGTRNETEGIKLQARIKSLFYGRKSGRIRRKTYFQSLEGKTKGTLQTQAKKKRNGFSIKALRERGTALKTWVSKNRAKGRNPNRKGKTLNIGSMRVRTEKK